MNPTEDHMETICCIGITVDKDNNPAPENSPKQQDQQQGN